jgi:hypothetical protein
MKKASEIEPRTLGEGDPEKIEALTNHLIECYETYINERQESPPDFISVIMALSNFHRITVLDLVRRLIEQMPDAEQTTAAEFLLTAVRDTFADAIKEGAQWRH